MKSLCVFLIALALVAGMVGCGGTPSEDLEIRTWYDLDAIRDNLTGHHRLMNDLDSTTLGYTEVAASTANQGMGWEPIGSTSGEQFAGTFDGQGFEIRHLVINRPDEIEVGLFRRIWPRGEITNLGVVNASVTGYQFVGALAGTNEGTVTHSYSTGNISANGLVGGLVGNNYRSTLSYSYFTGNVSGSGQVGGLVGGSQNSTVDNSYSTGRVTGDTVVGGLVGWNYAGTIRDSYSAGIVVGVNASVGGMMGRVGGLVGDNDGTVRRSYSIGSVTSEGELVGGLVGHNTGIVRSDSFWDTQTSGQSASSGGVGKTTAAMKNITTFSDALWSIIAVNSTSTNSTYIWNIVDDETYPFLSWEP